MPVEVEFWVTEVCASPTTGDIIKLMTDKIVTIFILLFA